MKIIIVVQSWNFTDFDLYIGGEAGKPINLGFPRCSTNSSGDFRGKRQGFDGNWKAKLKRTLEKHRATHSKANFSAKWDALTIALAFWFLLFLEDTGPNCFNVSPLLQVLFSFVYSLGGRDLTDRPNRSSQLWILSYDIYNRSHQ